MDLIPLLSTTVGAAVALGGAVIVDVVRSRDTRERDAKAARNAAYLEFTLALGVGLQGLRDVANSGVTGDRRVAAVADGLAAAGVYPAREKMLMTAPRWVLRPAEVAFDRLIAVRDAVRHGATTKSLAYHDAYHPYAEQMWLLRNAIRSDLGASRLTPSDLSRQSWENREGCADCRRLADASVQSIGAEALGKP